MEERPGQADGQGRARPGDAARRRWSPPPHSWLTAVLLAALLHQACAWAFASAEQRARVALDLTALGRAAPWPPPAFAVLPPAVRRAYGAEYARARMISTARRAELSAALNSLAAGARLVAALDARDGAALSALAAEFEQRRSARAPASSALGAALAGPGEPRVRADWLAYWPSAILVLAGRRSGPVEAQASPASGPLDLKSRRAASFRRHALDIAAVELERLEEQYGPISSAAALASLSVPPDTYEADKLALGRARLRLAGELAVEFGACGAVIAAAAERERRAARLWAEAGRP